MRLQSVKISTIVRVIGYLAVAAAIGLTALHFRLISSSTEHDARATAVDADLLNSKLAHCQAIGMAAQNDASCETAWGENRRRFFTFRPSDYPPVKTHIDQPLATKAEGR